VPHALFASSAWYADNIGDSIDDEEKTSRLPHIQFSVKAVIAAFTQADHVEHNSK
jgi:hypothetical protein